MKKLLSIIIALVLAMNMCAEVFAFGYAPDFAPQYPQYNSDYEVSGTNAFGSMMADAINSELSEQQDNNGFNVFSVEITAGIATVELETLRDSTVVVGIYDETGSTLLMTGSADVTRDDEYVSVTFPEALPEYFYIKAYLIDRETLRPLCTVYECPNYTREMQEFFSKTIYDFDQSKVLNLDEDATNNFAVYGDSVTVIPRVEGVNVPVSMENGVYVFANADENILGLQPGQIFSYEYAPGEIIIAKVATVTDNGGGTVTVTEQDTDLEEAFDYIKIDTSAGLEKATVDNSNLEEGIEYVGMTGVNSNDYDVAPSAFEGDGEINGKLTYNIKKEKKGNDNLNVTFQGAIDFGIKAKMKYYISGKLKYLEISLDYSIKLKIKISGNGELKFPIGIVGVSPIPGVYIEFTPSFILEASAEIEWNAELDGSVGARLSTDGCKNLSKFPKLNSELKLEGKFALGISLEPRVKVVHEKIAEVKLKEESKAEVSAKMVGYDTSEVEDDSERHLCKACIEGEVNFVREANIKATLLDNDKWEFKIDIVNSKTKIADFYYSFDYDEFGFGTCPHYEYLYTVHVIGNWFKPVENAKVSIRGETYTTDADGNAMFYIEKGKIYTITVSADGYKQKFVDISVSSGWKRLIGTYNKKTVCLIDWDRVLDNIGGSGSGSVSGGSGGGDGGYLLSDGSKRVVKVSLGWTHSAAITADRCLYLWGFNLYGQIGNGKTGGWNDGFETTPVKVMENVVSVSLADNSSAAITANGSLYTWGENYYGQLGDGTKESRNFPQKILDNVVSVEMNDTYGAALTKDGSLYVWGRDYSGKFGTGEITESLLPIKIMDNIAALPKGVGGIITKGGTLYTWGPNNCGDNGNGADAGVGSDVPVKVMDNVIQACHGGMGAAITADGGLYMWGDNEYGSLGNGRSGMSNYSSTPIKIMDGAAVVSIGQECSSAITDDGTLYTWGRNDGGRLGNGEHGLHTHEDTPVKIMNNTTFVDMGDSHTAAISKDGSLYMWGRNTYGQLGNGKSGEDPSNYEYCEGVDSCVPIKISIPADEPVNSGAPEFGLMSVSNTLSAGEPFTGLLPNEIYNVYGMRSRTVANPFSPDNLLYIYQGVTDASGNLYYDYQPVADCTEPVIFCKAMREFPVGNVRISGADVTETGITVKWDAYPGADMYRVYRVVNGIYLELGTTAGTSFTVSGLNPNWEYGFLVSSRVNGEWSYPSPEDVAYIATSADTYTLGDVNADGEITLDDAILTLQVAMNVDIGEQTFIEAAADANGDGEITLDDAIKILKVAMNVIE